MYVYFNNSYNNSKKSISPEEEEKEEVFLLQMYYLFLFSNDSAGQFKVMLPQRLWWANIIFIQ